MAREGVFPQTIEDSKAMLIMNSFSRYSLGIVAHEHIGEVRPVVDFLAVVNQGLNNRREVWFVEIGKCIALGSVQAYFMWCRREDIVC